SQRARRRHGAEEDLPRPPADCRPRHRAIYRRGEFVLEHPRTHRGGGAVRQRARVGSCYPACGRGCGGLHCPNPRAVQEGRERDMPQGADLRVREAMTADPITIDGMATINEALAVMRSRGISCLVVNRRDADDEYGLLLIADV